MKTNKINPMENLQNELYNDFEWVCARIAALQCQGIDNDELKELQKAKQRLLTNH